MPRKTLPLAAVAALVATTVLAAAPATDPKAEAWVRRTLKRMTLEEKVGQLVVPGLNGVFTPLDSDPAEKLDRLAREGTRFTQYYAGSTVCAPSRAALMTGRHTGHGWIRGNGGFPWNTSLRRDDTGDGACEIMWIEHLYVE